MFLQRAALRRLDPRRAAAALAGFVLDPVVSIMRSLVVPCIENNLDGPRAALQGA